MVFKLEPDRFVRQKMIEGWNQEKLEKLHIGVIGVDYLSQFLLSALAGLGVGHGNHHGCVTLYGFGKVKDDDIKNYPLFLEAKEGENKTDALEKIIKKINPHVQVCGINSELPEECLKLFFDDVDLLVETTNNPKLKKTLSDYSRKNNKPLIDARANESSYEIFFPQARRKNYYFTECKQGVISSLIAAGIIAEEVRKFFMPLETDIESTTDHLTYKLFKKNSDRKYFPDKQLLFVGAGALNVFSVLVAALYGFKIDVVDPDIIESSNLNRQIYFYDSVGKNKATVLKQRLSKLNSNIRSFPVKFDEKFLKKYFKRNKPDVIVGGVDNWETRALLNYVSLKYKIPYVDGGTDYNSGRVVTTYPEKTACLDCVMGVNELAEKEKSSRSCDRELPSVIMSNMITAGLAMSEVLKVIDPLSFGNPHNGILGFHSNAENRLFFQKSLNPCECYKKARI